MCIESLKFFKNIIYGAKIKVFTDHMNLLHNPEVQPSRAQRWKLLIEEYSIELLYEKGEDNKAADMLSRCARLSNNTKNNEISILKFIQLNCKDKDSKGRYIIPAEHTKPVIKEFFEILAHPGPSLLFRTISRFYKIPQLYKYIQELRKNCQDCQKYLISNKK